MPMDSVENDETIKCKICHELNSEEDPLHAPCKCKGSMKYIHNSCLFEWISTEADPKCEICNYNYKFRKVFKEDTPKRLPIHLILKDFIMEIFISIKNVVLLGIFFLKLGIIIKVNSYAVQNQENAFRYLFIGLLICVNYLHYVMFKEIKKMLNRYFNLNNNYSMRINPGSVFRNGGSINSASAFVIEQQFSEETESEEERFDEGSVIRIGEFIYGPFHLKNELKLFGSTCFFGIIIVLAKKVFPFALFLVNLVSYADFAWKNYSKEISQIEYFQPFLQLVEKMFVVFAEYCCFLKAQHCYNFIRDYSLFLILFCFITTLFYFLNINTTNFNLKKPFYFCKVYLVTSLSSIYLFILEGTITVFIRMKINKIPFSNGIGADTKNKYLTIPFFILVGFFVFHTIKCISMSFAKKLRQGFFTNDKTEKNPRILKDALKRPILLMMYGTMKTLVISVGLTLFLLNSYPVFLIKTPFEQFLSLTICFTVFKNRNRIEMRLFDLYFWITKFISSKTGLDNFLFNKKLIKFDPRYLVWASNKNKDVENKVRRANEGKTISFDFNIQKILSEKENVGFLEETHSEIISGENNCSFSGKFNRFLNKKSNSASQSIEEIERYEINSRRFLKYFGRKHKRTLGIFYKPRFCSLKIFAIKMICLLITKIIFSTVNELALQFSSHFNGYEKIVYFICIEIIVRAISDGKEFLRNLVIQFYVGVMNPIFMCTCLIVSQNHIISFSRLFYTCSLVSNLIFFFLVILFAPNELVGPETAVNLVVVITMINILSIFMYSTMAISYYQYFAEFLFIIYLIRTVSSVFKKALNGNWLELIRDKYYLKEKIVVDYESE
ncbi:hypothetical protein NUSPORA_00598 [Nucleospora cyclopteri]